GLIALGPATGGRAPQVMDWKAFPQVDGGSAAVILRDPKDGATRAKVEQLLRRLAADRANGIAATLPREMIAAMGGNPAAAFWVDMRTDFSVIAREGAAVTAAKVGGTHGYAPTHPEMLAAFFLAGPGVGRGVE